MRIDWKALAAGLITAAVFAYAAHARACHSARHVQEDEKEEQAAHGAGGHVRLKAGEVLFQLLGSGVHASTLAAPLARRQSAEQTFAAPEEALQSRRDPAAREGARLVVVDRLLDLLARVHDERAVLHDRLA